MNDEHLLVPKLRTRVLGFFLAALPVLAFVLAARAHHKDDRLAMLTLGFACAFLLPLGWWTGSARWRVNEVGVERLAPRLWRTKIAWRDVAAVRAGAFRSVVLAPAKGAHVLVPGRLRGLEHLRRLALAHAPAEAMTDAARHVFELESGVPAPETAVPVEAPEPDDAPLRDPLARWRANPFFVLEVAPEASRPEIERAGQKLLAQLAIGSAAARAVRTPVGEVTRTEDTVRAAMAELRDPARRLAHETWARVSGETLAATAPAAPPAQAEPWAGAMDAIGWRVR